MGLFLRANNLNTPQEQDSPKKGLFQRSLELSISQTDDLGAASVPAVIEVVEEPDNYQVDQDLKLNDIEIYEENDFSPSSEFSDPLNKFPGRNKLIDPNLRPSDLDGTGKNQLSPYSISDVDDFKDELSHQLIRSLERGKAFFLVKISIKTISAILNKTVSLNEQLEMIQNLMTDMGKAFLFGSHYVILVVNKMYKPDPVIFMHQFRSAIKRDIIELENLHDLEFHPVVRVFPEHGKTIPKLIDGLFN